MSRQSRSLMTEPPPTAPIAPLDAISRALGEVAPDAALERLDPSNWLHEEAGLDSLDFLRVIEAVERLAKITIPPEAYLQCATLSGLVAFVGDHSDT